MNKNNEINKEQMIVLGIFLVLGITLGTFFLTQGAIHKLDQAMTDAQNRRVEIRTANKTIFELMENAEKEFAAVLHIEEEKDYKGAVESIIEAFSGQEDIALYVYHGNAIDFPKSGDPALYFFDENGDPIMIDKMVLPVTSEFDKDLKMLKAVAGH